MVTTFRQNRRLARVRPGDGSTIQDFRFWQLFSRSVFVLDDSVDGHVYEVDVRHGADSTSKRSPASLYRDGVQINRATLPATFPVPGGAVDVAVSQYGLKRMHFVADDGSERMLRPHPRSQEGLRARFGRRFPVASAAVGVLSVLVLLAGAAVTLTVGLEALTRVDVVAAHVGTFVSPVPIPEWVRRVAPILGAVAGIERALTLRSRWRLGG